MRDPRRVSRSSGLSSRVSSAFHALAASAVGLACLLPSNDARAEDPEKVEWSKDWPRVRWWEVADVVGLTVGASFISADWKPATTARWQGPILFDKWMRNELRGRTYITQETGSIVSDTIYKTAVLAPNIVDVYLVALGVHQSPDVAIEMLMINVQSLGLSGVVALASEHAVGRARPFVQDCKNTTGQLVDSGGHNLFNSCKTDDETFQSFFSGHTAAVMTMAGTTCAHHQHLPLYGGGFADLAPCLVMVSGAVATGVGRMVSDRHWASDVLVGAGVGWFSGYVVPSFLHYGFGHGKPIGEVAGGAMRIVPVPQAFPSGAGVGVVGIF